jgi:hypothetical protein
MVRTAFVQFSGQHAIASAPISSNTGATCLKASGTLSGSVTAFDLRPKSFPKKLMNIPFGELIIIPVWAPTIIPEYHYPARSPGLSLLFQAVSTKLWSESCSDSNQLLSDQRSAGLSQSLAKPGFDFVLFVVQNRSKMARNDCIWPNKNCLANAHSTR